MPPPDFDLPDGAGDRARRDFDQTLTDLYIEKHMAGFIAWARTHGMRYRTQPAFGDAFDAYLKLREHFGPREVFLLESQSGPASVTRRTTVGFGPLAATVINAVPLGGIGRTHCRFSVTGSRRASNAT